MRILILMSDTGGGHRSAAQAIEQALAAPGRRGGPGERGGLPGPERHPSELASPRLLRDYPPSLALAHSVPPHRPSVSPRVLRGPTGGLVRRAVRLAVGQERPDIVVSVHPLATAPASDALRELMARGALARGQTAAPGGGRHRHGDHSPGLGGAAGRGGGGRHGGRRETPWCGSACPLSGSPCWGCPWMPAARSMTAQPAALRRQLGWEEGRFTVLLVGGGEGAGGLEEQVEAIAASTSAVQLAVVAGRNERLQERLRRRDWGLALHSYGFVQQHAGSDAGGGPAGDQGRARHHQRGAGLRVCPWSLPARCPARRRATLVTW